MAEHRVSMLAASLFGRRLPDHSPEPRFRSIEEELAELRIAPDPDPVFRTELRAQLVAIAPRLIAESAPPEVEGAGKHRAGTTRTAPATAPARHADARGRRIPVLRFVRVATALVAVAALLLGGAFWLSRDALPGDNLYGLKRAGERIELSFASNAGDRGLDELKFSQKRAYEVLALWKGARPSAMGRGPSADPAVDDTTARLIADTLDAANDDLYAGASILNQEAVRTRSASLLAKLTAWASGQATLLDGIGKAMKPTGTPLVNNVGHSASLVRLASQRSSNLDRTIDRACQQQTRTDEFGPTPCTANRSGQPSGQPSGGRSGGTGGTGGGGTSDSSGGPRSAVPTRSQPSSAPASRSSSPKGNAAPPSSSKAGIVPLPANGPVKVSTGTCVSVSAGPIGVGVCPTG